MSILDLIDYATESLDADALVIGIGKGDDGPVLTPGCRRVDEALSGGLRDVLVALGATGARDEVVTLATVGALPGVPVVAAVGLGPAGDGYDAETVRRASGAASRALTGRNRVVSALALVNGSATGSVTPELRRAAGEGALMGAYQFTEYKSETPAAAPERVSLLVDDPAGGRADADRAAAVADAVALCRDLVNTAPNDLSPARFADLAAAAANEAGLSVEVLDERALAAGGYGGILGVGMGSARPPRLVRMRYQGAGPRVALVGKGITFDSGGISIKPAAKMDAMKSDMAGAAAVVATAVAAARLNLPVEVIATVPMAENLPGGGAYRPADVLTMYGGKRVEVLNTDAEGRLILADAIVRACADDPAYLIDTATLTGAQVVALGGRTSGVMGTEEFRDRVVEAGQRSGEAMWAMPLPEELRTVLDSTVADLANVATNGAREGGMLVAGQFLADFVADGVGWAHIDVAGPAFNTGKPWGYTPRGGTGVPVRTMLAALEDIAANG